MPTSYIGAFCQKSMQKRKIWVLPLVGYKGFFNFKDIVSSNSAVHRHIPVVDPGIQAPPIPVKNSHRAPSPRSNFWIRCILTHKATGIL